MASTLPVALTLELCQTLPVALTLELRQCQVCHTRVGLTPCESCNLVYYCCAAHQSRDQRAHEHACSDIKKAMEDLSRQYQVGSDNNNNNAQRHLKAEKHLKVVRETLHHFNDIVAVQSAISHLHKVLHLSVNQPIPFSVHVEMHAVRDVMPQLYLRIGRDQESYDFIKFLTMETNTHVRNADPFECPIQRLHIDRRMNIHHIVAVMLIKVRILLDLQNLQNATRAFRGILSRDYMDMIRNQMPLVSNVVAPLQNIIEADVDTTAVVLQVIKSHVKMLFDLVHRRHPKFWNATLCHEHLRLAKLLKRPPPFPEAISWLYDYDPWRETPGANKMLEDLLKAAGGFRGAV